MKESFIFDDCGGASIQMLFASCTFLILGGFSVDLGNAHRHRDILQAVADAASTAGALELPDKERATAAAFEFIEKNFPDISQDTIEIMTTLNFGSWNNETHTFTEGEDSPTAIRVTLSRHDGMAGLVEPLILQFIGFNGWSLQKSSTAIQIPVPSKSILGGLDDYLLVYTDGSIDANWQSASKGFVGNVAVDGVSASERTSGSFDYIGTLFSNEESLGGWSNIIDSNPATASLVVGDVERISRLEADFENAFSTIENMPVTLGFEEMTPTMLNGLNVQDGINNTYIIDMIDLKSSTPINITGDACDLFYIRWDSDPVMTGFQGQVKFQGGGGINPKGMLKPTNFINLAGDINSSGGGSNPSGLAAYLAGMPNVVNGGGFFTGYWLTVGNASGQNASLSNGIIVGGWYSSVNKFSMTSGTSGIFVSEPEDAAGQSCFGSPDASARGVWLVQ